MHCDDYKYLQLQNTYKDAPMCVTGVVALPTAFSSTTKILFFFAKMRWADLSSQKFSYNNFSNLSRTNLWARAFEKNCYNLLEASDNESGYVHTVNFCLGML